MKVLLAKLWKYWIEWWFCLFRWSYLNQVALLWQGNKDSFQFVVPKYFLDYIENNNRDDW